MNRFRILLALLAGVILASFFPTSRPIVDVLAQNVACYREQGGASNVAGSGCTYTFASGSTLAIAEGSTVTFAESQTFTLGADEKVLVDGATTAQTNTDGALDINFASVTADATAINISATQNNGTTAAVNSYAGKITLTQNDADGDLDGILMSAAATANAAAGSYEYFISMDCAENTASACTDGILIASSGVDAGLVDAVDASASNITNAISIGSNLILGDNSDSVTVGATDNALTLTASTTATATFVGADAAGAANTLFDTTGAGAITIGSADVTSLTAIVDNDVTIQNGATGSVTIDFRDYADSADDDMAHAIVTVNCTDATTGAEDCDYSVGVAEGGAAADTRFSIDADGGVTVGSSANNLFTVTTDGTGTGEVVLPTGSVESAEITDATLLPADDLYPGHATFTVCGDATTVNNNTVYYGPSQVLTSSATAGSVVCDTTAVGNVTEATADAPAFTAKAFIVLGLSCYHPDSGNTLTFTARSAEAGLTPALVVTTADNELQGMTSAPSTTAIASGATFAVAVASSGDIGTIPFRCDVDVAY